MSSWLQEKSGQVTGATQVKAGEATKTASETAQFVKDRAVEGKDQTGSFLGEKTEAARKMAVETTDAAKKTAGEVTEKASETTKAGTDRAGEGNEQTGSFLGEKTEAAKKMAVETTEAAKKMAIETTDAAKQKATETAQYVQDRTSDAAQGTKDYAVAGKDTTGNVFQQAGEQVMGAAVGAKDAVMNTLGMGGDKGDAAEKITKDH